MFQIGYDSNFTIKTFCVEQLVSVAVLVPGSCQSKERLNGGEGFLCREEKDTKGTLAASQLSYTLDHQKKDST